jgi:hypothetical protein
MGSRRTIGVGGAFVLSWLASAAGCASAPSEPSALPPGKLAPAMLGCDLASRPFRQTSPGPCGTSDWQFVLQPDGAWRATEAGCASASGVARYDGATVTLDFQYAGGTGRYTWPLDEHCRGEPGRVTWFSGPLTGKIVASTLASAN